MMYIHSKPEKADVSAREIEALLVELEEYLFGREESMIVGGRPEHGSEQAGKQKRPAESCERR